MTDTTYLSAVISDRTNIDWFTLAPRAQDVVAGPAEIYVRTADGVVTWGWRIEPIPVDPGDRTFRRFRHPDGWAMFTDKAQEEVILLPAPAEVHLVADDSGAVREALAIPTGEPPGSGDSYTLQKANGPGTEYLVAQGWPTETVSAALSLWCSTFLGQAVSFHGRPATDGEADEIAQLEEDIDEILPEVGPVGRDDDAAELIEGFDDVFWFQGDVSWPDSDDAEAFRDRVDVRIRYEGIDSWLVSVESSDRRTGSHRILPDGSRMILDPSDSGVIGLEPDRVVLAVSVQDTGFEPAGVAVPIGRAPGTDQWEELRRVWGDHPGSIVIHAPAWGENRVSLALTEWARAWTDLEPRFIYDFNDPVSQAAIEANNLLEDAAPTVRSIRTATQQVCGHSDPAISEFEEPLPCGRPATAYYRVEEQMVVVCDDHAPPGEKLTTLLRA
jgi:hypothetical protein